MLPTTGRRAGQALLELLAGLVALLVVIAATIHIQRLARAETGAWLAARREAGFDAMQAAYWLRMPGPRYVADWRRGPDGRPYSRDDTPIPADAAFIARGVVFHAHPASLRLAVPNNAISDLEDSAVHLGLFRFVHGHHQTDPVPLDGIMRKLIYRADSLRMEADAWLTWTRIE